MMYIREVINSDMIAEINAASRSIVCLDVPWSGYPKTALAYLLKAVEHLQEIGIEVAAFKLDEESDLCQQWLATLGLPEPYAGNAKYFQGWGAMFWLEAGRVVDMVHRGDEFRTVGIIQRTKKLWSS
jgi:hypothetical protein